MVHYWTRTFETYPEPSGYSRFTIDPWEKNGIKYFTWFTLFTEKYFCTNGFVFLLKYYWNWFKLAWAVWIQFSLRVKLGLISRHLEGPDPFKTNSMWAARSELVDRSNDSNFRATQNWEKWALSSKCPWFLVLSLYNMTKCDPDS